MKYSIFIIVLSVLFSCNDSLEEFKKNCPYEFSEYPGHYLRIPVTITPHKKQYIVGDTIHINTIFSDSIKDLGAERTFKIEGFPFKPHSLLYRFTEEVGHSSGYRVNELEIDSVYKHDYFYSSKYADGYRAYTIYQDNQYRFESQLILREPGRYILLFSDLYQNHSGSGNPDLNAEADAIQFEGKCPGAGYYLCSMIDSGDDHLQSFRGELVYLDEEVYRGRLRFIKGDVSDFLGGGGISVEFNGFFGFEVLE